MWMAGDRRPGLSRIDSGVERALVAVVAVMLFMTIAGQSTAASICTIGSGTTLVEMQTRHGTTDGMIVVRLCSEDLPVTVGNFLAYVDSGAYTDTGYIHRSDTANNVVQGGGFYIQDESFSLPVETMDPIGVLSAR